MFTDFEMWRRAQDCIAQGALTNSKHPSSHVFGVYPTHIKSANKAKVTATDDTEYVDYICGLGTNLLGYGNEYIERAVKRKIRMGACHSLPTNVEVEAAEKLCEIIPYVDRIKFLKSGTEACNASITIARAVTKRHIIYSDGYHGHGSEFTSLTPPANGCIPSEYMRNYNDDVDLSNAAAVIVEPWITDHSKERTKWLLELKEKCKEAGCLLIFDEVITGFRVPRWTVGKYRAIAPDLTVLGKSIAGGMPLAAVCGKKEVMDRNYFVSSTYAGDVLALECLKETIDVMSTKYDYKISDLWSNGANFIEEFNAIDPKIIQIKGYPTRGVFVGTDINKAIFFQEMAQAGVLMGPSWFYNFPLQEYDKSTLYAAREVIEKMSRDEIELKGEMPSKPFALSRREKDEKRRREQSN